MTTLDVVVEIVRWLAGAALLARMARIEDEEVRAESGPSGRRATVVIPARNEEHNLTRLLERLNAPATPGIDVLVVDDGSTDGTAAVASRRGVRVVAAGEPPPGWTGKNWACHRGFEEASGDVVVFVDADVVVGSATIAGVVAMQARLGGIVSVQPWHAGERAYEQLSVFPSVIAAMGVGAFALAGRERVTRGAFGPCLAVDRDSYRQIGGHAAVRAEVVEDVALATRARSSGVPVTLLSSRGDLRYRMYPAGVAQVFEGWTKNMAIGAGAVHPVVGVLVVAWVSGLIAAPFAGPVIYGLYALQVLVLSRRIGRFHPLTAAVYPVALAFFLAVFVTSVVRTLLVGEVRWRGRTISTRGR